MAIRVKLLQWESSLKGRWIGTPPAKLGDLAFWVFEQGHEYERHTKSGRILYPSLEAAKAAAQSDYEARILSAIEVQQ